MRRLSNNENPILPIGKINLLTGHSKYFNVYETWDTSTYEIWEVWSPNSTTYKVIATGSDTPTFKVGTVQDFVHDQTHARMFTAKLVNHAFATDLKKLASVYGKSLAGYTYK